MMGGEGQAVQWKSTSAQVTLAFTEGRAQMDLMPLTAAAQPISTASTANCVTTTRRIRIAYLVLATRAFSTATAQSWPLVSIHASAPKAETERSARVAHPLASRIRMIGTATRVLSSWRRLLLCQLFLRDAYLHRHFRDLHVPTRLTTAAAQSTWCVADRAVCQWAPTLLKAAHLTAPSSLASRLLVARDARIHRAASQSWMSTAASWGWSSVELHVCRPPPRPVSRLLDLLLARRRCIAGRSSRPR